jgi:hypothetical protein
MDRIDVGPTVDGLIELLRQAEWSGDVQGARACPWCRGEDPSDTSAIDRGHLPTCPVVPVLYPKEKA